MASGPCHRFWFAETPSFRAGRKQTARCLIDILPRIHAGEDVNVFWFLDSGHGLHGDVSVRVEVVDHGVVVLIRVLVADLLAEFLCVADFWSFDDAGLLFYGQLFVVLDFLLRYMPVILNIST